MKPLMQYAVRKGLREKYVWIFLFGPLIFLTAPMAAVAIAEAWNGRPITATAFRIPTMTLAESGAALLAAWAALTAAVGGAAAFWAFRSDFADRSVTPFLVALRHPEHLLFVATGFGSVVGLAAGFLALPLPLFATAPASDVVFRAVMMAVVATVAAASIGMAVCVAAPTPGNVGAPAVAGGVLALVARGSAAPLLLTATVVLLLAAVLIARHLAEKQCAS